MPITTGGGGDKLIENYETVDALYMCTLQLLFVVVLNRHGISSVKLSEYDIFR